MTSLHVPARIAHLIADGKVRHARLRPSERDIEPWRRGGSYAVIPPGKPALCRILIEQVETIDAGDHVRAHELRSEGYPSVAALARHWMRGSRLADVADEDVVRTFDLRHASTPAVRLTFRLDTTHRPRLLHAQQIGAYTEDPAEAAKGEPEAVPAFVTDRQEHDAAYRREAGVGEVERRILTELQDLTDRLARFSTVDLRGASPETRSTVQVIRQRVASLQRQHGRAA